MIHETAVIHENASVGDDTKVWHFTHVREGAVIGTGCSLGQNVYVDEGVYIGNGVKIQNNVSLYKGVRISDDVFLGPSCVFTNVKNPRSHNPTDEKDYAKTLVGKGASIGANATIVCGVSIGTYAFVGAGSVVTKDVPPHTIVYGNRAKHQGYVCRCGEKLSVHVLVCPACKTKFNCRIPMSPQEGLEIVL